MSGWPLAMARLLVLTVSAITIGLGIYTLVLSPRLAIPCDNTQNACLLSPAQVAPLARLGISPIGLTVGVVLISCAAIALATSVAAMILWRRPRDMMALLVALTLVLLPAYLTPMYQTLPGVWHTLGSALSNLGGISFLLLLGLFPSGRFVPRWVWIPLLALALNAILEVPAWLTIPVLLACAFSIIGAQVYRYRKVSTPLQRQQTKWAVGGLVATVLVNQIYWQPAAWGLVDQSASSLYSLLWYLDAALMVAILAVSFGVAILRYRLYDIDVVIRRTLIYGVLTAILAAIYFVVVFGVQRVAERLTGVPTQQPLVIVATTLLVAALFAPLRRRIQAVIDRAFYRRKYNAALTLAAFGARMRTETDLGELRVHLAKVVQETMQPAHISVWLRVPARQGATMEAHGDAPTT